MDVPFLVYKSMQHTRTQTHTHTKKPAFPSSLIRTVMSVLIIVRIIALNSSDNLSYFPDSYHHRSVLFNPDTVPPIRVVCLSCRHH